MACHPAAVRTMIIAVALALVACGGGSAESASVRGAAPCAFVVEQPDDGDPAPRAAGDDGEARVVEGHEPAIGSTGEGLREGGGDGSLPQRTEVLFEGRTTPDRRYLAVVRREMREHHFLPITECLGELVCDDLHATVELVVEANGQLSSVRVVAEAHEERIRACVEGQLSGASFPVPPERIGIRYPFRPEVGAGC